ncbi:MAG: choice-of-anchor X domain-containing protein [Gammaproteobacteria bacterium]
MTKRFAISGNGIFWACASIVLLCMSLWSRADLRTGPSWYDPDGIGSGQDWHYRVPVAIPGGAGVASTVKVDVDFAQLLGDLGVNAASVNFDESSVRVVRPNGVLAGEQEFTDQIFAGALDPSNNSRGEVKFILDDAPGAGDYFIYFDIVGNGAKATNPQNPINGNFEQSAGSVATSWTTSSVNTGGGERNQVINSNVGSTINLAAACSTNATNNIDNSPNNTAGVATGDDWYLLGYRENCEDGGGGIEQVQLNRGFTNPSGAARGNLTFAFQYQAYDALEATGNNYDYMRIVINGAVIDHTTVAFDNVTTPVLRQRNVGIGSTSFTPNLADHGWRQATIDMTAFPAGATTLTIEMRLSEADDNYRSWVKLDDVEWAIQTGSLGPVEAFGANITLPSDTAVGTASAYSTGQVLAINVAVDARPTSVLASVTNQNGTVVASGITLFDDGTRGDGVANDGVFSNDGSDGAFPTYTFLASDPTGAGWLLTVEAFDDSVSSLGVASGLLHIDGQSLPVTQANYWNVDQQVFTYAAPELDMLKTSAVISDPFSGVSNPKRIPGAYVRYQLTVTNSGNGTVDNNQLVLTDPLPADSVLCVGPPCASGDPVIFNDAGSPVATGLTYVYGSNVTFSTDGVSFSHTPTPDGEGFDDSITHVRITPAGAFSGNDASFVISLTIRVE